MSTAALDIDQRIGAQIRLLRMEQTLTLEALAARADVSRAMLSRIERGESSPTAQLLGKICAGLRISMATLFADAATPASPLARRSDQPVWRDPGCGYLRRQISPAGTGSPVSITEVEFPPEASVAFDNQRLTGMDQHVWVLDGTLEMALGEQSFRLKQGDCLMMRFDHPILFRNPTTQPVRYAVIISHGARS